LNILLTNTGNTPIYEQIFSQIRRQILSGDLSPGEALPSMRALAKDLRVSVITTKRAYEELERAGFLHTIPGKGCYVAQTGTQLLRERTLAQIEEHLTAALTLSAECGLSEAELIDLLHLLSGKEV